jgi:hypothetical protein
MVFVAAHSHRKSVWVNTEFDAKKGRIRYVYVIPDMLVTLITLQLTPEGDKTRVEVEYDRTALSAEADAHVRHMAEGDCASGPEWEKQVNGYLKRVCSQLLTAEDLWRFAIQRIEFLWDRQLRLGLFRRTQL